MESCVTEASDLPTFECRRTLLLAAAQAPFVDDPWRDSPLPLDGYDYQDLLALPRLKLADDREGWVVEARIGGRPFLNFDDIRIDDTAVAPTLEDFAPPPCPEPTDPDDENQQAAYDACVAAREALLADIAEYFQGGRGINRLEFYYRAAPDHWPLVLVLTPDGYLNLAADAPMLLGTAVRLGTIGEPWLNEALQHLDELEIGIADGKVRVLASVHSELAEGVIELLAGWDAGGQRPVADVRAALGPRGDVEVGVVGATFLRGPAIFGMRLDRCAVQACSDGAPVDRCLCGDPPEEGDPTRCDDPCSLEGGIDAYHDGQTALLLDADGGLLARSLLVPPLLPFEPVREVVYEDVPQDATLIIDQLQGGEGYYSRFPDVPYGARGDTEIILRASSAPVRLRRAQVAIDPADVNPEANETANVYFAVDARGGELVESSITLRPDARDHAAEHPAAAPGVVFVSDRDPAGKRLYFLPVDGGWSPAGPAYPLTDRFFEPARPSARGATVIFDALECQDATRRSIYLFDLSSGSTRRLTVDAFVTASDRHATLGPAGAGDVEYAFISRRSGVDSVTFWNGGLECIQAAGTVRAIDVEWSPVAPDELAVASDDPRDRLLRFDRSTGATTPVATAPGLMAPAWSPGGERIAFDTAAGLHIVDRLGGSAPIPVSCDGVSPCDGTHACWAGPEHVVVAREVAGNSDLYLVEVATGATVRLTDHPAADVEPACVGANPGSPR